MFSLHRVMRLPTVSRVAAAMAVAIVVGQLAVSWLNLCGTTPESLAALALGTGFGVILMSWLIGRIPTGLSDRSRIVFTVVPAAVLAAVSWWIPASLNATLLAGCDSIDPAWPCSSLLTLIFPATIATFVTATTGLFFRLGNHQQNMPWTDAALTGAPGVIALSVPVWFGQTTVPLAASVTVMTAFAVATKLLMRPATRISNAPVCPSGRLSFTRVKPAVFETIVPFAASGILSVALLEIFGRLMPGDLPVLIQTVFLTAIGLIILSRPLTIRLLNPQILQSAAILMLALLPLLFGPLAELNLKLNTAGLSAWSVLFQRSLQCAVFFAAALTPAICMARENRESTPAESVILPFLTGILLALEAVSQNVSAILILSSGILLYGVSLFGERLTKRGEVLVMKRTLVLPALSLLSISLVSLGSIATSTTSSFLFSERTAAAMQRGVAEDLIAQSCASRLVTTVPTPSGEITVWRRTGDIYEFQRNGILIGRVSTDTNVSPQPAEDILPAILALSNHVQPSRVLVLGDDTGACLRVCSHFPLQEIVAVRTDRNITQLARKYTWSRQQLPPDRDERVQIMHEPATIAVRRRELRRFDIVIAAGETGVQGGTACQYTAEFYEAIRSRMSVNAVFCQRFRQSDLGPEPLKAVMSTLMNSFVNVGVIQTVPGEIVLLASDSENGLIDSGFLARLQREHARREIATAGWDWAQIAILPLLDVRDPLGMYSRGISTPPISIANAGLAMSVAWETARRADKLSELQAAFAPHQQQILAAVPATEDVEEIKRRLSALAQQLEILAGMPDQPWTYRKSLQMEMKQSPRPPRDLIESGKITKVAHPLDLLRQNYFISLGKALTAASRGELNTDLIRRLDIFTDNFEPLITHFAHYEIIRLHELSQHPNPAEEFRHRMHIAFFTSPTDASVRPIISAVQQLVDRPSLIADETDRYDILNSLLQKMIERWEARTAWEPRSALRVQNDVDLSVSVANRALALMEELCDAASVEKADFYARRRFLNAALIKPLRDYRDQVLAHRMKSETPVELNTEDPHDLPLLINSESGLNTN